MKRSIISTVLLLLGMALLTSCTTGPRQEPNSTGPRQDPKDATAPTPSKP